METDDVVDVCVPQAGTETEGTVEEILLAVGDIVTPDQAVMVVEMDKAAGDVYSPLNGEIVEIAVAEGAEVRTGDLLFKVRKETA